MGGPIGKKVMSYINNHQWELSRIWTKYDDSCGVLCLHHQTMCQSTGWNQTEADFSNLNFVNHTYRCFFFFFFALVKVGFIRLPAAKTFCWDSEGEAGGVWNSLSRSTQTTTPMIPRHFPPFIVFIISYMSFLHCVWRQQHEWVVCAYAST